MNPQSEFAGLVNLPFVRSGDPQVQGLTVSLSRLPRTTLIAMTGLMLVAVAVTDYLTGYEISFSVFYLPGIALATWFVGKRFAQWVALTSVACWLMGDFAAGASYSSRVVLGWNAAIMLSSYLIVVGILSSLRGLHEHLEQRVEERTRELTREMAERARLEKALLDISEREQRRIGHDLHDSLCQHLTGTALAAQVLGERLASHAQSEAQQAEHVVELIEEGIGLARSLARGLSPVDMGPEGLMAALHELARLTSQRLRVECRFEALQPVNVLDTTVSTHLFRIAQESVSNALRHGKATRVFISLRELSGEGCLMIENDGPPFAEPAPSTGGMGLHIMRHRAGIIGAAIKIQPLPAGTRVECRWKQREESHELG